MTSDFLDLDLVTLAALIRQREISAAAVVDATLERIAQLDPLLHAFCTVTAQQARSEAKRIDARLAAGDEVGPLAGAPVAVKDLICTRGVRTTFGSRLYAEHIPDEDDVVVERLKAAGAIVIGKTNTSEFGYGPFGHNQLFEATRNPWNTDLTSGGSSAGSAAAVAARMVPLSLGSDGGGSVRIPASLCGVFGIKPSWGRVPVYPGCRDARYPGASGWESLEHIGPLTRTVADGALALSTLVGPSSRDRHSVPAEILDWTIPNAETLRGARIAFSANLGFATVDAQVRQACWSAVRHLESELGCVVEAVDPSIEDMQDTFEALVALDTDREGLRALGARHGVAFAGPLGRLLARAWTADEFTRAIMSRKRIANVMWRFMERFQFFITPATATPAFPLGLEGPEEINGHVVDGAAWVPFSALANLTGQPAASVPIGFTSDGRPIGLQIMGRHLDDIGVLAASALVEALHPLQHARPKLAGGARVAVV